MRQLGEILRDMPKNEGTRSQLAGGSKQVPPDQPPTLASMGISK